MALIRVNSLGRSFGDGGSAVVALHDLSLTIEAGNLVGLGGSSGSGKSTLLNILGLADGPTTGTVELSGKRVDFNDQGRLALRRRELGYLFQYFNLLPTLSALENIMVPLLLLGIGTGEARMRALRALEAVQLADKADSFPRQLSGGQMQRVAFCRATVHEPLVVLADEPTGNLDSRSGELVVHLLRGAATRGAAVLVASHDPHVLRRCDRVIQLRDGCLVRDEDVRKDA